MIDPIFPMALRRYFDDFGDRAPQPGESDSGPIVMFGKDYYELRNINGRLAVYGTPALIREYGGLKEFKELLSA